MAKQPIKGLGRGLDAIFDIEGNGAEHKTPAGTELIPMDKIVPNPGQPRQIWNDTTLDELAASIRMLGIIQPITLRAESDGRYMIISGERRWRASQRAGLAEIPAYVRDVTKDELLEMGLVENIQREDLNPMEIAQSLKRLIDECGLTQEKLSERVGKKRSTVANYLRLNEMSAEIQVALRDEYISMGHAKVLASIPAERQAELLKTAIKQELSVRQLEILAKQMAEPAVAQNEHPVNEPATVQELPEIYSHLTEELSRVFSDKVAIKRDKTGGGQITIGFADDSEIGQFIEQLKKIG